jgi:hypothetical protein
MDMTWDIGTWGIIDMDLLYKLTLWSKVLVCYMCLGSNGYFITDATLIGKSLQDIYH